MSVTDGICDNCHKWHDFWDCAVMWDKKITEHRWSGWPGAFCLDCGCEDPREIALADGDYEEICDEYGNILELKFRFDTTLLECPKSSGDVERS